MSNLIGEQYNSSIFAFGTLHVADDQPDVDWNSDLDDDVDEVEQH